MTPLGALLARRIARTGPITVAAFMAEALGHPRHGYYMRGDPFGATGDFVTAPEISQMFGELIGSWTVSIWRQIGRPPRFVLAELGPGRGTLMADALRAITHDKEANAAAEVHLVETSPALGLIQRARLGNGPAWHERFDDVPPGPIVVVANELFDALPVHQVERAPVGFRERMVGLGETGCLAFALAPGPTPAAALARREHAEAAIGAVIEVSPVAIALMDSIARRVVAHGGAALIVDFAAPAGTGTLQAVRRHGRADPLEAPGETDLAVAVDFATLARVAREASAATHGPVGQGAFLEALGIRERAARLARVATAVQRAAIDAALELLTGGSAMGHLFKAFAVTAPGQPAPAGFEPAPSDGPEP